MVAARDFELLSTCIWTDGKRNVHFRIVDCKSETGVIERKFGLVQYEYCNVHDMWEGPHTDALLPMSEWPRLMAMAQHITDYTSSPTERPGCEKSNEQLASHLDSESYTGAQQRHCVDANGNLIPVGEGCASTGTNN